MALLADIDDSYTRTGKGTLARWADKVSYIPGIGGILAFPLGAAATVIETAQYLFRGQFGSAVTALVAGGVSTTVNTIASGGAGFVGPKALADFSIKWWIANAASGGLTGANLGTHARAATESVIGVVTGALGVKPKVLQSNVAGIGGIGGGMQQAGPGKFFSEAARSRGEDPNTAYARMQAGQADHLAALEAARAQGTSAYRGA